VTPAVAAVGRTGCWPEIGRAAANSCGVTGRDTPRTGREPAMAAAGMAVAAPRLMYRLSATLLLMFAAWPAFRRWL
jgi:hypothetical protein